jgi:hypothetical protein
MDRKTRVFTLVVLVLMFSSMVLPVANAYIDGNSGSYILQMIAGGALAVGLGIRVFWHKIVSLFTGRGRGTDNEEQPSAPK